MLIPEKDQDLYVELHKELVQIRKENCYSPNPEICTCGSITARLLEMWDLVDFISTTKEKK